MAKEIKELRPVPQELVDCSILYKNVLGYTDTKFCERDVVAFRQEPNIFGSTSIKKSKVRQYTLNNGILNQCSLHVDGRPSVYWAVLDAMSTLKNSFTKDAVIEQAVATLVKFDGRFKKSARKACAAAFYILKTHTTHPARRTMGFGFIVEQVKSKHFSIRARKEEEAVAEAPLATVVVNKRV